MVQPWRIWARVTLLPLRVEAAELMALEIWAWTCRTRLSVAALAGEKEDRT